MLGMLLSAVGNCMRAVEPAQRNLIDEPELVHEAREDLRPSSSFSIESDKERSRECPQRRHGIDGWLERGGGWDRHRNNASHNDCIIEEHCGVQEELPQHPTHARTIASVHQTRGNNNNKNQVGKKKGSVVKGSATRRPLVLLFGESLRNTVGRSNKRSRSSSGRFKACGSVVRKRTMNKGLLFIRKNRRSMDAKGMS